MTNFLGVPSKFVIPGVHCRWKSYQNQLAVISTVLARVSGDKFLCSVSLKSVPVSYENNSEIFGLS